VVSGRLLLKDFSSANEEEGNMAGSTMSRNTKPIIAENIAVLPNLFGKEGMVLAVSMSDWSCIFCEAKSTEEVHRQMEVEHPGEQYFVYAVPDFRAANPAD
jgi:hypothetical protein